MEALKTFGITRCPLQCALPRFTVCMCFALSCAVLLLNVLMYFANYSIHPSTIVYPSPFPSTVKVDFVTPLEVDFRIPLEPEQRALLDLTFKAFTEAMDSNNVTFFVEGGTLLGSWRHHDIIPWDDDIDVMVNTSEHQKVRRVLQAKVAEDPTSFGLYERSLITFWKFYPQKGQGLPKYTYKTPAVDIFFYRENETHIWNAMLGPKVLSWLKSHVFPLIRRPFGNLMVPAPCNPKAFLAVNINISQCQPRTYNHIFERSMPLPRPEVPCSRLEHLYPFVHRENTTTNGSEEFILEKLMFKNSTLRRFMAKKSC